MASQPPRSDNESTDDIILAHCKRLAELSISQSFGFVPYPWQIAVGAHMNMMTCGSSGIAPAPIFLNRHTGGGKSLIRDGFAASQGGVTWSISPLLSLGADQETKISEKAQNLPNHHIVAIHLDNYRRVDEQKGIKERVEKLSKDCTVTVIILSSPQVLRDSSVYYNMFKDTIQCGVLKLFAVDEAHLFVQFGLYFRDEFFAMKSLVFDLLAIDGGKTTRVPVLFMTATATERILEQLEKMTGLVFNRDLNIFWPNPIEMMHRVQKISFTVTEQPISEFKKVLASENERRNEGRRQWIYFSNSRIELEAAHEKIKNHYNEKGYPGDIILITGPMFKEQKFFYTNKFLNSNPVVETETAALDEHHFNPIGCMATRGLGGAGWDGRDVHHVFSPDWPPNLCSLAQEKGRVGRRHGASPDTDSYVVCGSLRSYIHIVRRMYMPTTESNTVSTGMTQATTDNDYIGTDATGPSNVALRTNGIADRDYDYKECDKIVPLEEYQELQYQDFLQVLQLFVLPNECYHVAIERRLANPFTNEDPFSVEMQPCGNACDYCLGAHAQKFPRIVHAGVKRALVSLFLGANPMDNPTLDDVLVERLQSYPNAQKEFFASRAKGKPEPRQIKKLILMLLAAEILTYRIGYDDTDAAKNNPKVLARLNYDDDGNLFLNNPSCWSRIPSKEPIVN
jgi:hypothetical protein